MLALIVALTLSQCTKDTDCKGERICAAGACVDPVSEPVTVPLVPDATSQHETVFAVPTQKPKTNPFKPHLWVSAATFTGIWLASLIGDIAYGDQLIGTTVIPIVGPFISYARWHDLEAARLAVLSPSGQALLLVSGALQSALFAYLMVSVIGLATYTPST